MSDPKPPSPDVPSDAAEAPARRRFRGSGLLDRVLVLRRHWLPAGLVFLLVFGFMLWKTLRATPTFEASATLTIETTVGTGSVLADLAALGKPSKVETEMEVLRSFTVARGAAQLLLGLPAHVPPPPATPGVATLNVAAEEVNAYRPWEGLLRAFGQGREPCRLKVRTEGNLPSSSRNTYIFRFAADGASLRVLEHEDAPEGDTLQPIVWDAPFQARGRVFEMQRPTGDIAGRTYHVFIPSVDQAAERIFGGVKVSPVGRYTDVVQITYSAPSPHEAQEGATALAQSYIELRQLRKQADVAVNQEWLEREIDRLKQELVPLEKDLDAYIAEQKAVLLSEQTTSILSRQVQLRSELAELERERSQEQWKLQRLQSGKSQDIKQQAVILGPEGVNSVTTALSERYAELNRQRASLLNGRYTEESREVQQTDAEIEATRAELESVLGLALEDRIEGQQRLLESLDTQAKALQAELDEKRLQLSALPEVERGLTKRKEQVEATRQILQRYTEKFLELKSAGSSGDIAATLVDAARMPSSRSSPSLFRQGLLGVFLGLLAAVGLAFFLESLDHKVRTPEEVEEGTGLTVYATIPAFAQLLKKDRQKLKTSLITVEKPHSVATEAYRTLRANIRFANTDRPVRTLAITSSLPQEGKTTTICNLAVVFAQAGSRVLVVDADLRRPSTHLQFGGSRAPGLTEVLRGETPWRKLVTSTTVENLSVLHAGAEVPNPGALLDSAAFSRLLADLKEEYEYVFFDVPPVLAVADAAAFFRSLDGILLLSRFRRCPVEVVDEGRQQVERVGGRLLGAVFNGFEANRSYRRGYGSYGYYGYYGYAGHYGYAGSDKRKESASPKAAPAGVGAKEPRA